MTARPSRILFACPQTVFDVSNGASMQVYSMLQEFSRRGIEAASFCGGVFDDPAGAARIPNLAEQIKENQGKAVLINKDSSANSENPITHWFFTGFHSTVWNEMTHEEETNFLNKYTEVLRTFKPDLVIGYGCDALCRSMWMEARSFGIPTAYIICNGNHHHYRFPLHDIVLCDSKATAKLYKDEDGLTVHPFGNVINPELVVAKQRNPQTVTFINPAFAKGVAVVARLILMANKERPDISFMVVETRKKFADALRALKKPGSEVGSAFQNQTFKNIALRDATYNVSEIYATTKVLLAPSLCYESWGRVATEATMNGIPVLASKSGGLPEAVGTGGITLEKPASNQGPDENWLVLPSEEECRPWADALYDLYDHTEKWTQGGGDTAAAPKTPRRIRSKRRGTGCSSFSSRFSKSRPETTTLRVWGPCVTTGIRSTGKTSGSLPAGNAPSVKSQPNSNFLPFAADTLPAALLLTPSLSKAGEAQRFAGFVSSVGSSGSAAVTISAAKTFALAA